MSNERLRNVLQNLPLFASHFLKLRSKSGAVLPFEFNIGQGYLHERLEAQLKETGKVRAIILKGRQGGCSTYVQGRFFHKVCTDFGKKAFILTHEAEATKNIFDITKRFHDNLPEGLIPEADSSNAKELNFKTLNSGYTVGTAGNKAVGRSQTIQLLHASEVAYYQHAEEHAKGILQTVSNEPGTEIIMESTANGFNYFYNMWQMATSGESDFQAIFIPWYWQTEYTASPRDNSPINLTDDEESIFENHKNDGLTLQHIFWRRKKLLEFSNDYDTAKELFNVEYPMTALDAFRNPVADRFIKTDIVIRARKNRVDAVTSPLVLGVDPALSDMDSTAIIRRKGRMAYNLETYYNLNTMELAGLVKRIIDSERPSRVCIDCIGIGAGICDRLQELGYANIEPVNVARTANDKDKFKNLRAELWHEMREWLCQDNLVEIPKSDVLLADLTSLGYKFDSSGRLQIESKQELRARGMKSPDTADALALTFAVGMYAQSGNFQTNYMPTKSAGMLT